MKGSIAKQIATGTFWTVLMRMSIRLLGIISILILVRILAPEDYGLIAKAVLLGGFLELITQFGFGAALIKNQHSAKPEYDTVWTLSIIRSLFLALVMIVSASLVKDYFNEPRIEALIYCYALAMAISGFNNVGVIDFQKHMNFDKDFKFHFVKKLASFIVTILVAIKWETYWAFPAGVLTGSIMGLIASFIMSPYRPVISLKAFDMIFHFSKWMFLYEILSAMSTKLDTFLLSKFGNDTDLGLYTISYEVASMPSTEIAMPIARAALPGLSKLNDDVYEFQKMYQLILSSVFLIVIPAATGLSLLSTDITLVALGSQWEGASPIISILAFFGLSRVINSCSVSALIAFDRVAILSKLSIFNVLIRLIALPIGVIYFGYIGLAFAVLFSGIIWGGILLVIQHKIKALDLFLLFKNTWRTIVSTMTMALLLSILSPILGSLDGHPLILLLMTKIIIGIISFLSSLLLLCFITNSKNGPESYILKRFFKS